MSEAQRPPITRTIAEFIAFSQRTPLSSDAIAAIAAGAPCGDGSAVLVLPSSFRDDKQTETIRLLLGKLNYRPFGWELGRNLGPTRSLREGALARLGQLARLHGPISIVGFSMGGLFARWLAARAPALVRQIVTVGSPIRQPVRSVFLPSALIEAAWPDEDLKALSEELEQPLMVPALSLYSRNDGIVTWQNCRDPRTTTGSIEVTCHHVMMPQNPEVFRHVAEALARPRRRD